MLLLKHEINEVFMLLQELPYWDKIKHFMEKEYRGQWFRFMGGVTENRTSQGIKIFNRYTFFKELCGFFMWEV